MVVTPGDRLTLQILHYIAPVAVVAYFVIAKTVAACYLQQASKRSGSTPRRYLAIACLAAVIATLFAQAVTLGTQSARHPDAWPSQDVVIYVLLSILTYGCLALGLIENGTPLWHPYVGACFAGFAVEVPCTVMQVLVEKPSNHAGALRLVFHLARVSLLLLLSLGGLFFVLRDRARDDGGVDETAPLLGGGVNGHASKPASGQGYDTIETDSNDEDEASKNDDPGFDSDSEEPEKDKELRAQRMKRLQESGSWLNYFKEFKIFIPILWPSRNRFVQACLVIVCLVLSAERVLNVLIPRQLGRITDQLATAAGTGDVPWRAVGLWMLYSWLNSQSGLQLVRSLATMPVQQFTYKSIGSTAFRHVMGLSMTFHNDKSSGELIRAIDQGQNLQGLLEFVCFEVGPMFVDLVVAFVYVYTLFDIYMSVILLIVGVIYIWIGAKTTLWSVKQRRRLNSAWRNESKVENEAIHNWQTVSHFNRSDYECERYDQSLDRYNSAEFGYYVAYYVGGSLQTFVMVLGRLAAALLAAYRIAQGTAPVGNFVTLTFYWGSIEGPLAQVSWSIRRISQMLTDSERLLQLLKTQPTVIEAANAREIEVTSGHVEFDNVDFAYDVRRPTLTQVNFEAKPGQTIALVGETGGGKSTILKLLYRYYDVAGGTIRIDGQDIRGVTLDSLRNSFGMVPQDPSLFNISIADNVRYARLDASDQEVTEACQAAAIHDKIQSFPDKYKSTVGERGVKLSGGELQRVSIARAILRQPKIVLLDEATSMIDAETEALIQQAFKRLTAGRTTFIIAHRLSTIQHADLILVINDGRIVERGTHEELFRRDGRYVALWSKQMSKEVRSVGAMLGKDGDGLSAFAGEGEGDGHAG